MERGTRWGLMDSGETVGGDILSVVGMFVG